MHHSHIGAGLVFLALALVLVGYMCAHFYYSSRVDCCYIDSLVLPDPTGVHVVMGEDDRATMRAAWKEAAAHGGCLYSDWSWWGVVAGLVVLLVLVASYGTALFGVFRAAKM